jgi:uncharacterized delta-60 repeat protein
MAPALLLLLFGAASFANVFLDPVFNQGAGTDNYAEQVLPLEDGKVLLCGNFWNYNGEPAAFLIRLNEDGSLDHSFHSAVNSWVRHMALQADGKIVVGGAFSSAGGESRNLIARLNADGSLDASFNPGRGFEEKLVPPDPNPPYVFWLAIQPDGKILVTGSFAKYNGEAARGIVRLNPDGSIDRTFHIGTGLDSWGRSVSVLTNNQILLSGWFTDFNGFPCNRLIKLNADGAPDLSFRPYFGDKTAIYCAVPLSDGRMLVSGHSKSDFGLFKREVARLNIDGSEDPTFLGYTSDRTECIAIQPDGKIIVSGWFLSAGGESHGQLARFNSDGSIDHEFQVDADYFIWNVAFDSKGRILLAGGFHAIDGVKHNGVARLLESEDPQSDGDPDSDPKLTISVTQTRLERGSFLMNLESETNRVYELEYRDRFDSGPWTPLTPIQGNGGTIYLHDDTPSPRGRCYRVRVD